jgi:hypothetical protein
VAKFLVIGLLVVGIFLMLTNKGRLPRRVERIAEDFTLAKNRWATGTWSKDEAAKFLSRLHTDATDGARRNKDAQLKREAKALANEILAWTADNIR